MAPLFLIREGFGLCDGQSCRPVRCWASKTLHLDLHVGKCDLEPKRRAAAKPSPMEGAHTLSHAA